MPGLSHTSSILSPKAVLRALLKVSIPVMCPPSGAALPTTCSPVGLPSVWAAYSPHDEQNHAPNENTTIEAFVKGIRSTAALIEELAEG
jgi:acetylornithine deacetylase/succinyl-diaminopimelate desuccinylase-like protein